MKILQKKKQKNFYIQVNGRRKFFETLEDAQKTCSDIHKRTGIILGIVPCGKRGAK